MQDKSELIEMSVSSLISLQPSGAGTDHPPIVLTFPPSHLAHKDVPVPRPSLLTLSKHKHPLIRDGFCLHNTSGWSRMSLFIQTSKQSPGGRGEERGACLAYFDIRRRGRDPPAVVRIYFRPMIVTGQGELSADHCEVLTKSETFKLITSPDQQSGGLDSVRRQMQCPACYE